MLMWVMVAIAAFAGLPWVLVGAAAIAAWHPLVAVGALTTVVGIQTVHRRRGREHRDESILLRRVGSRIRSGATLRAAIAELPASSVGPLVGRLCRSGAPMADIGDAIAEHLPTTGRRFAALCAMSEATGAPVDAAIDACLVVADAARDRERRLRTATTQARMSAWIVGCGPLVLTVLIVLLRGVPEPGGVLVVIPMAVGLALQVAGMALVFRLSGNVTQ
ncbi:MAG: hypothetical protein KDB69_02355 [Acidimicrobiia bacterium]|nr:hypothetical protein [Acidimicrobiia bacterium]